MSVISQASAHRIWLAHREIDVGKKLLAEIEEELASGGGATPERRHDLGRRIELGAPSMSGGHRLLDVSAKLAVAVIKAHIAAKEAELVDASQAAAVEAGASP